MNLRSDKKKRGIGCARKKKSKKKKRSLAAAGAARVDEGGSFGRKDTATVRRYETISFLPSSISSLFFSLSFCAAEILNWLDKIIQYT